MGNPLINNPYSDDSGNAQNPWQRGGSTLGNILRTVGAAMQNYGNVAMSPQERMAREQLEASMAMRRAQLESINAYRQAMENLGQRRVNVSAAGKGLTFGPNGEVNPEEWKSLPPDMQAKILKNLAAMQATQTGSALKASDKGVKVNPVAPVAPAPDSSSNLPVLPLPTISGLTSSGLNPVAAANLASTQAGTGEKQAQTQSALAGIPLKQAQTAATIEKTKEMPTWLGMKREDLQIKQKELGMSLDRLQMAQGAMAYKFPGIASQLPENPYVQQAVSILPKDENGNPIGYSDPRFPTVLARNKMQQSMVALGGIADIQNELRGFTPKQVRGLAEVIGSNDMSEALANKMTGPVAGRVNKAMLKLGLNEPQYAAINTDLGMLATLATQVHGGSGRKYMIDEFKSMLSSVQSPEDLFAATERMKHWFIGYMLVGGIGGIMPSSAGSPSSGKSSPGKGTGNNKPGVPQNKATNSSNPLGLNF